MFKYGDAFRVSHALVFKRSLGKWACDQRSQYRLLTEGRRSTITPNRREILEAVGFHWDMAQIGVAGGGGQREVNEGRQGAEWEGPSSSQIMPLECAEKGLGIEPPPLKRPRPPAG